MSSDAARVIPHPGHAIPVAQGERANRHTVLSGMHREQE